jgi:1,4-dihydroxy-6-naphthoate synthase
MTETRITVAHSPDSDDAFMFYGLASNNVDTGGIAVDQVLSDIETLNRAAFEGRYEVTAVSFHAYAHLIESTRCCRTAPAWATVRAHRRCPSGGPTQVKGTLSPSRTLTTAYLTLRLHEPDFEYVVVPFDQIGQAVLDGRAELVC